jgi:hypothetical protein
MTEAVLDGAAAAGASLAFPDHSCMYGPADGPLAEETPQRAHGDRGRPRTERAAVLAARSRPDLTPRRAERPTPARALTRGASDIVPTPSAVGTARHPRL